MAAVFRGALVEPKETQHTEARINELVAMLRNKMPMPTGNSSQYVRGDGALATMPVMPTVVAPQAKRLQTSAAGTLTWTFATPFAAGVIPIVNPTVEDTIASGIWNWHITAISNTAVSIKLTKTNSVTLLGITLLGIVTTTATWVHLTASNPT